MDKVENVSILETFENDIELHITLFCEKYDIDDLRSVNQSVFNALLIYLNKNIFSDKDILKDNKLVYSGATISNNNRYDANKISIICDYYIYICLLYEKEISIRGFSYLTGISDSILYEWGSGGIGANSATMEIFKKLHENREESLQAMLTDKTRKNSIGVLSVLNHYFGWSTVYAPKTDSTPQISDIKERYNVELIADVVQSDETKQENP